MDAESSFELRIEPTTGRFDPDDDRWRAQVAEMVADLGRDVDGVRREHTPVPGTKGSLETLVVALGSAGAFTAAVELFRSWLGRDRSRGLDISWSSDGNTHRVSVRGDAIDETAIQAVAEAAARKLGGPGGDSWPAPTAPS